MKMIAATLAAAVEAYLAQGHSVKRVDPFARNWDENELRLEVILKQHLDDAPSEFALEAEELRKCAESVYAYELMRVQGEEMDDEIETPLSTHEPDHMGQRLARLARGDDWDGYGADEAHPGPAY